MLEILPLSKLKPSKENPRRGVGDVKELAASIAAVGLLEPLIVTLDGSGGHVVIAGNRRLAGAKAAGLAEVPCIVREFTDEERTEVMLVENLQRVDLAPLEEASGYQRLVELGWSQRKIAQRIGRSQGHVSKRLTLLELPEAAAAMVDSGSITLADGLELAKLREMPKRMATAIREVTVNRLGVDWAVRRQFEEHADAERRGAILQKLRAAGIKVIEVDQPWWHGDSKVKSLDRYSGVGVPEATHKMEPCHAVVVLIDGKTIAACTSPRRHAKEGDGARTAMSEDEKKKRRAKIDHNRARRAAQEVRDQFLEGLFKKKVGLTEATELLIVSWSDHEWGAARAAGARLGIKDPLESRIYGRYGHEQTFGAHLKKNPKDLARLALALAVESFEKPMRSDYPNFEGAKPYFAFLERHGYQVAEAERLQLAGKAPR